jgi:hypothetical protein
VFFGGGQGIDTYVVCTAAEMDAAWVKDQYLSKKGVGVGTIAWLVVCFFGRGGRGSIHRLCAQ